MAPPRGNTSLLFSDAAEWVNPGSEPSDMTAFADVEVQLIGTVSSIGFERSLNGVNFVPVRLVSTDDPVTPVSALTVSVAGIYRLPGGGWLRRSTGSATTVVIVGRT
jgi:hypothetical protein